ncbi:MULTISPECIES: tetratricopeptide repeat protein [unclassified Parabacteroides]|uniref:tetratricopeptide repeat protein n=1 Tax=unclassified Parabacteroides TaxID=2649774 RepID=UPI002473B40A|nr:MULTISPECIES: tetratricopeptide repeat protein [unclassified Parabacteroides]
MKIFSCISILFLIVTLSSCGEDKTVSAQLQAAERLMEQAPDSSLSILQQIPFPEKQSAGQYALWCLLFTQAQDKNYIPHTTDSLIRIAVSYYEKTKDKEQLMKAWYYNAAVYHELGDSPRAQDCYLKALEAGKESGDHAILGRIYSNLGLLYIYQHIFDSAIEFQKKAIEHFSILNDTVNIGLSLRNIGRIYAKQNQPDSAIHYYSQAIRFLSEENTSSIYNELGGIYKRSKEYSKALEYIQSALSSLTKDNDTFSIYQNLGDFYRKTGQKDSAFYYSSLALQSRNLHTKANSHLCLSYLEKDQGNYSTSLMYRERYQQVTDSIRYLEQSENLQRIQSLYNYRQIEKEKIHYQQKADKRIIHIYQLAFISICCFVLFILFFLYYLKSKRKENERKEKRIRIEEVRRNGKEEESLQKDDLLKVFMTSPLYQKFTSEEVKISDTDWNNFKSEIDTILPKFNSQLKILRPTIKEEEIKLCYLIKVDISVKQIAHLLYKSSQGISLMRRRLYEKISGKEGSANDFDKLIHEL